ncbi:unnamed protein product [Allacma fusca]|uniref:Peptidase M14 domain-containing protein n=1 Tax=Allacma fusca TaxID=39272 RepID=A0A8J2NJ03_9HEXA|nr:unnamed protein product [Allacma fusca]
MVKNLRKTGLTPVPTKQRFPFCHPGPIYNCHGNRWQTSVVDLLSGFIISLACLSFIPRFVTGLQCYECLSLQCHSGIICESIKSSIARTFIPNSHYIHFDPQILCPSPGVPTNSSEWDAVAFNCSRSDSLCLEAPVDVISAFDGLRDGKKLDLDSQMTSKGFLRGCASRRGLKELPGRTISVRKICLDNETHDEEFQRMEKFHDGYKITRIHYHEIYVDHGTENATRHNSLLCKCKVVNTIDNGHLKRRTWNQFYNPACKFQQVGCQVGNSNKIRYDGYKVYRIHPRTAEHAVFVKQLEQMGFHFWNGPSDVGKPSDVMLAPHQLSLLQDWKDNGIIVEEYIENVQKLIENEVVSINNELGLSFTQYSTLDQIDAFLQSGARDHSDIASVISIGKSFEGRDLNVIKISKSNDTKPVVFIDANIHAREWITSAVATFVIDSLLNGTNTNLTSFLNDFDIYVLPVLNPDGFVFTHQSNRLWRKTRSNYSSTSCLGADPNRNFGFHWLEGGSSTNPCSETHAGAKAFSEPETVALSKFLTSISSRLVFYLSIHSYGHYILIPYGHTNVKIPEYNNYYRIGSNAARSIAQRYGKQFRTGNVVDLLYVASGESFDWVKGILNPYLSLGIELRDQGQYGFVLPASQIIESGQEFVDGLVTFLQEVKAGTQNRTNTDPRPVLTPEVNLVQ